MPSLSNWTLLGYLVVFAFWGYCIYRDGRTGIGIRFMFGINLSLYFLLGPMLGEVFGSDDPRFYQYPVDPAVRLALGGMAAYVFAAYMVMPAIFNQRTLIPAVQVRLYTDSKWVAAQIRMGWLLTVLGIFGLFTAGMASRVPTVGAVFGQLGQLADVGFLLLIIAYVTTRRFQGVAAVSAIMLGRGILFAGISGHAGGVIIGATITLLIGTSTDRLRLGRIVGGIVVAALLTVPAGSWLAGRSELRRSLDEGAGLFDALSLTVDIFINPRELQSGGFADRYRQRGDFSDLMAAAMTHTPAVQPFAAGDTYFGALTALLPRVIWSDKQLVAGGNDFVSRYTGITFAQETNVGVHYMFEMYVNFGMTGVVVGMFLLGLVIGGLERLYYVSLPGRYYWQYASIYAAGAISLSADRLSDVFMAVPPGLILCWLVLYPVRAVTDMVPKGKS